MFPIGNMYTYRHFFPIEGVCIRSCKKCYCIHEFCSAFGCNGKSGHKRCFQNRIFPETLRSSYLHCIGEGGGVLSTSHLLRRSTEKENAELTRGKCHAPTRRPHFLYKLPLCGKHVSPPPLGDCIVEDPTRFPPVFLFITFWDIRDTSPKRNGTRGTENVGLEQYRVSFTPWKFR